MEENWANSGQDCAVPATDPNHCGGCFDDCEVFEACVNGNCTCNGDMCDGDCTDVSIDPNNCGMCGVDCGDGTCVNGTCTCAPGDTECGDQCVDLQEDDDNCGVCGNACLDNQQCVDGMCVMGCGGNTPDMCNGECTNTEIDPDNCGQCDRDCNQDEVCLEGNCDQGFVPQNCDQCPCDECQGNFDRCCEVEGAVFCAEECP